MNTFLSYSTDLPDGAGPFPAQVDLSYPGRYGSRTTVQTLVSVPREEVRPEMIKGSPSYTFVVDGEWLTIGSMNFDNRSLALNDEATLMALDRTIGQQMDQVFLDDLRSSEEITLARFRQRSWLEHVAERAANLFERFL